MCFIQNVMKNEKREGMGDDMKHKYRCVHCGRMKEFSDRDIEEMQSGRIADLKWKCRSCKKIPYSKHQFEKVNEENQEVLC